MRDIEFINQLATKLCHELTGPIGAVNHGLEAYELDSGDITDKNLSLTKTTAKTAQDRLMFFRSAYGVAKSSSDASLASVRDAANGYLADFNMRLKMDNSVSKILFNGHGIKIFLCLIWLVCKAVKAGSQLELKAVEEGGKKKIILTCISEKIFPDMLKLDILEGRQRIINDTPDAHSYYTKRLVDDIGADLRIEVAPEKLEFVVTIIPV
jgi:histidine phosphotransferase ChpT